MYIGEETRPSAFNAVYFAAAIVVHIVLFLSIWYIGICEEDEKEIVIPMELMVVINENPDGVENQPPPETPPVSEPDPPPPEPPKEPDPPPPEPPKEPDVTEAVVEVPEKPKPPEPPKPTQPPKPPKPPEPPKKPDPPKKPEMTREQRMAEMRNRTTKIKNPPPRNNGRTDKRPQDWEKLLMQGYRPGATNQGLDAGEEARCFSLIRQAFYSKWDRPAWTSSLKKMCLSVRFGAGGKVIGYSLTQSSGDASADRTVLRAASQVGYVRGLTSAFLEKNKTVIVRFEVTPE